MPTGESRRGRIGAEVETWLAHAAGRSVQEKVRAGATRYDRSRDLPGLARIDGSIASSLSVELAEQIVARLAAALRAERGRARSGHWTYDLNRHIALRQAYVAESERLAALKQRRRAP